MDPIIFPLALIVGGALLIARKPFTLRPVDGRVTSPFGRRVDPIDGTPGEFHNGVDFAAAVGTRAVSIGNARVASTWRDDLSGLALVLEGTDKWEGWTWSYAHLSAVYVDEGATVTEGEHVADTGNSGRTTGPHLHFVIKRHGQLVDPLSVLP